MDTSDACEEGGFNHIGFLQDKAVLLTGLDSVQRGV